jgi:predicted enzyme related to lactoylglutathione lyase
MPVPGWGCLATCMDTENNLFGLWEEDENAK